MPAGGLPSAAKALLVPENIRSGVHIKGGGMDVVGNYLPAIEAINVAGIVEGRWSGFFPYIYGDCVSFSGKSDRLHYVNILKDFKGIAYTTALSSCTVPTNIVRDFKAGEQFTFGVSFSGQKCATLTILRI